MAEVVKFAKQIKLDTDKLLGDWIVCIPGFTLQKYRRLQKSQLSIFSRNCFGAILMNILGLPFYSPFKNLLMVETDFIQFLKHPRLYFDEKLVFRESKFYRDGNHDYPIFDLANISVHMLHYPKFDEAPVKWEERKKLVNWYNLIAIMETKNLDILEKFDDLPYGKKVCFVPFKSNLDSAFYIDPSTQDEPNFTTMLINYAFGKIFYYDVFDMLLYGKKTPLIDM